MRPKNFPVLEKIFQGRISLSNFSQPFKTTVDYAVHDPRESGPCDYTRPSWFSFSFKLSNQKEPLSTTVLIIPSPIALKLFPVAITSFWNISSIVALCNYRCIKSQQNTEKAREKSNTKLIHCCENHNQDNNNHRKNGKFPSTEMKLLECCKTAGNLFFRGFVRFFFLFFFLLFILLLLFFFLFWFF